MHLLQSPLIARDLGWQRRVFDGHDGRVYLLLRDRFDRLSALLLRRGLEDAACGALRAHLCCFIADFALDDELVLDQVGEDVAIETVRGSGVEGSVGEAGAEVEGVGRVEVEVGGDDNVELGVEAGLRFCVDRGCVYVDSDARVQLLDLRCRCFGALRLSAQRSQC